MKPITRLENFLAKIAKDPDAKDLTPKTRKEYYLNEIAAGGGGGGDEFVVTFTKSAGEVRSADHTYAEIEAAIDAGKTVVAHATSGGGYVEVYPIVTRGSNYTTQKQRILFATPLMPSASGSGDDGFSDVLMVQQNLIWIVSDGTMGSKNKSIAYA